LKQAQEDLAAKLKAAEDEKEALQKQVATAKTAEERQRAQKALDENQRRLQAQQEEQKRLAAAAPAAPATSSPKTPPGEGASPASANVSAQGGPAPSPSTSETDTSTPGPSSSTPAKETPASPTPAPAKVKLGDLVELWGVDVRPKQLNDIRIDATPGARQNRLSGTIYVEVLIDEAGRVVSAKVVKGLSPDYGMNQACQDAAMKLKYSPALKDGVPVKTKLTFPILIK
jgi:TonB family protein